jgi:hypothetical protein
VDDTSVQPLNNAECSVLISVNDTLANQDRRRGRSLTGLQKDLVAAAHTSVEMSTRLETVRADPRWVNGGPADDRQGRPGIHPGDVAARGQPDRRRGWWRRTGEAADSSGGRSFRETFDPHQALITERTLLIIEIVFVLVEFVFWYGVFSENVNSHAPVLDPARTSDALLAVMVPLSGVVGARVVGSLVHRVVSRYPGIGPKEFIGSVVSAVVAVLAIVAIFSLVHARFDASSQPLGATQLPTLAMTLVFVVVLLGDMVARIFLVSEIRAQTSKWLRHLDKLKTQVIKANRQHAEAWLNLRSAVQGQLDRCERIVATGARLISDQRSRAARPTPELPGGPQTAVRSAHAKAHEGAAPGPMAVPSSAQLSLYGVSLVLGPLRVVEDAIDTLRKWPPRYQTDVEDYLGDVLTRLYRLQTAAARPAPPAARPHFQDPPPKPIGLADANGADPADQRQHEDQGDAS